MNDEKYELLESVDESLLRMKVLLDDYFKEKEVSVLTESNIEMIVKNHTLIEVIYDLKDKKLRELFIRLSNKRNKKELEKVKELKKMVRKEFSLAWKRSVALDSGEVIKIIDEVFKK